nr:radical SAM protein [uncultured Roseibium sp.]
MKKSTNTYKHALSVTGQIYFCSAPIRLDSYDTCQLGCTYCFSRKRSRNWALSGIHHANPKAFRARLERVSRGVIRSAADEFLQSRVPLQLGGLQDPFTPIEAQSGVTLELLRALRDYRYPTLISTKGSIFMSEPYLSILREMNVVVRFSVAGIAEHLRRFVEPRTGSFDAVAQNINLLSRVGVACGIRFQPVFPGFESDVLRMASKAADAGVRQISFEYLKLPNELIDNEIASTSKLLGYDIAQKMKNLGIRKIGPDWSLVPQVKKPFVRKARRLCHSLGVGFGAGDTEFIPWSDGEGCCGAMDLTQKSANHFKANFVGVIRQALKSCDNKVQFSSLLELWSPKESVGNYMDWRVRIPESERNGRSDWLAHMAKRWNGGRSPYSPAFFDGVSATQDYDDAGFKVYDASQLAKELSS